MYIPVNLRAATQKRLSYKWDKCYLLSSLFKFGNFLMYIGTLKSLWSTLRTKTDPKDSSKDSVYTVDRKGCDKKYVGETKRKLKVPVKEHQTETEKVSKTVMHTIDRKRQSQSEMWDSGVTDHSVKENHVTDRESA